MNAQTLVLAARRMVRPAVAGSLIGPSWIVAVGYMDPGNWATDLAAGAQFGYQLLFIVAAASLAGLLLQFLSARLGLAELELAEACRLRYSRPTSLILWLLCEIAIIACDVAEIVGTAMALNLLFGIPMLAGVALSVLVTMGALVLERRGFGSLKAGITALVGVVILCFVWQLAAAMPNLGEIGLGLLPSTVPIHDMGALYLSIGIIGATVMPHNLYLHSALIKRHGIPDLTWSARKRIRYIGRDSAVALSTAFFVNAAILILAAAVFSGRSDADSIGIMQAHVLLEPALGGISATLFALGLLAAGQNATVTATLAGQYVMEGFLGLKWSSTRRRLVTRSLAIIPAALLISTGGDQAAEALLIASQVVLALQLPFAATPLIIISADRRLMGSYVASKWLIVPAAAIAAIIVAANAVMLLRLFGF